MTDVVRINLPGYFSERHRGRIRHRVRAEGDVRRKITVPVDPDDATFLDHYLAARAGEKLEAAPPRTAPAPRTLAALVDGYLQHLERRVASRATSPATARQRRSLLSRCADMPDETGARTMGSYHCDMPSAAMLHIQDQWGDRTAQADACIKALRGAYAWGMARGWIAHNPAMAVRNIHTSRGGTIAWSADDVRAFAKIHPIGTAAHTWLMLGLWTGARIGDMAWLGRAQERTREGVIWLEWQPGKKGSAPVALPMADQLVEATRASKILGPAYILSDHGRPFANGPSLAERVRKWTADAGLQRRSSHGLRKAMAELLAEAGATEHQIMAVMAHTSPKTSAIYTRGARRGALAAGAMAMISGVRVR